jgi:hypothetical protein
MIDQDCKLLVAIAGVTWIPYCAQIEGNDMKITIFGAVGRATKWIIARSRLMLLAGIVATTVLLPVEPALGQGCIVARSNGQAGGPESEGGYLTPGEWEFGIGYRHQFSFRHFVGPVEQTYRIQQGTQVMNKINLVNFSATYQATTRFSFTVDMPLLLASRRSNNSPYTTTAQGVGDATVSAQGWIWNPKENTRGNVEFGLGLTLPTGKDNVKNVVDSFNGQGPQTVTDDYSIQPGSGGYGILFQWVSYKNVGPSQLYFNGSYVATPQNTNNVLRKATALSNPLTAYNSISDQYLLEAGIAYPVNSVPGLTVTFGPRDEGVPARDLIGDSLGFRRPGFAISLEPGFQYARNRNVFTFNIGKAIYRDRTRSVPDVMTGGHGDAAFADWVWLASYSFRYGGRHSGADHHSIDMLPHS